MKFLRDLIRWFFWGERRKNTPSSQAEIVKSAQVPEPKVAEIKEPTPKYESATFDFLKDNPASDFLIDLQAIRPLAEQFDRAREDLLRELQRLAPPKKRIFQIFKKAA